MCKRQMPSMRPSQRVRKSVCFSAWSRSRTVFSLLSDIQEEVHRFAITYHRKKCSGSMVSVTLQKIPGVGKERARALLRQFGSVKAVSDATVEELLLVKDITRPSAEEIVRYFREETDNG